MSFAKIKDHPGLVKDLKHGVILNNNPKINEDYLTKRSEIMQKKAMENKISNLEDKLSQLEQLLQDLAQNKNS